MNQNNPPIQSQSSAYPKPESPAAPSLPARVPEIPERWLITGRVLWWVITLIILTLTVLSFFISVKDLQTICPQTTCENQLSAIQVENLRQIGLSVPAFALIYSAITFLVVAFYVIVAFILYKRQSARWIGLLGAFTLVLFGGITLPDNPQVVSLAYPTLRPFMNFLNYLGGFTFPLFLLLFPDGRAKPRWSLGLIAAWGILRIPPYLVPGSSLDMDTWPSFIQTPIWIGFIASLTLVQLYRYRRFYGPVLRQQAKWVVYGMVVAMSGHALTLSAGAILRGPALHAGILSFFIGLAENLFMTLIPISIAIAILRYRLWDIDFLINRTLVYVPLTAIVGGLYSASVAVFQKLFVATTGAKSDVALVMTTFVVVATFTPIKNSLQTVVDKRFKDSVNPLKEINTLDNQVRSVVEVLDARLITRRLLDTAIAALHASGGAVYLEQAGQLVQTYATPGWQEEHTRLRLPLDWNGRQLGALYIGPPATGSEYSPQNCQVIQRAADRVAHAVAGFTDTGSIPGNG